jgi:hypothetical protein
MEAASRPPLELLPDLPVEEPLDSAQRAAPPVAPPVLPAAPAPGTESKDPVQTSIQFLDPAALLLATAEIPALAAAPAPKADAAPAAALEPAKAAPRSEPGASAPAPTPELELLEDPAVVEELLTTPLPPPPAPKPLPAAPAPTLTPATPPAATAASAAKESAPRLDARVPIAKTVSLSAAAHKVAAATKRASDKPAASIPLAPAPRPAAPAPAAPLAAAAKPKPGAPAPAGAPAENLASWTSARAAATPAKTKAPAPVAPAPARPAVAKAAPAKAPSPAPVAPPPTSSAGSTAPLDRDSIARNQIVERYLSGRLPLKGATEFEQYCARHPEILDELGLPERVNAGLRLLEAAGKPEPWQEAPRPAWQKPQVTLALAIATGVLAMSLAVATGTAASKSHRIADLLRQVNERPLDPATSTREIRLVPSRSGASNSPAITIGGAAGGAQLADFKIDESRSPYHIYRITIDRIDQGRVGVLNNLVKDSNGHLRLALNSSALGPGNYQLTIEGLNWRGDPEPDSWITIGIARPAS